MLPDLFRRLKPVAPEHVDRWWLWYQLGSEDERRHIEAVMTVLGVRHLGMGVGNEKIVLEPPPPDVAGRGELWLGNVSYAGLSPYALCLSYRELLRHVFLLGPSGTGKSTFIIGLLRQFLRDHVPFWCVDFKRNYRCLAAVGEVVVVTMGRGVAPIALNVLSAPSGVGFAAWVEALADIIGTAYLLLHGARSVLKRALLSSEGGTLRDARDAVAGELVRARGGSRRYGWLESTHRALEELSTGPLGDCLNNRCAQPLHALLDRAVVFELEGLGEDQQRFVSLYLLQLLLFLRKHASDDREVLRHVLVFDEAHNVFRREQWGELSLPSKLVREVREYGEAVISATQQADVADSLIANSGTKIILRTDHPRDVDFAAKLLQVETKWITKIPVGHAIVRLPSRYYQSFLITFPEQPIKNTIVPDAALRTTPSPKTAPTIPVSSRGVVSEREQRLLVDVRDHPISTTSERYERLGWNPKTGTIARNNLLAQGLAAYEDVPTPKGRIRILYLTRDGHDLVGGGRPRRHGGAAHEYWREQCRRWLRRHEYAITTEHAVGGGRTIDLVGTKGSEAVAIEVETGKSDINATMTKLAAFNGRRILFCTNDETALQHRDEATRSGIEVWTPNDLQG